MKKKQIRIRWERVMIYLLLILLLVLFNANYKFKTSRHWVDDVNAYAIKLEVVRK